MRSHTHLRVAGCLAVASLVGGAPTAGAQSAGEQAAYIALLYTPVAGLPPVAPWLERSASRSSGLALTGRVGTMSRRGGLSLKTAGLGVELPAGRWAIGGTLAYLSASCGWAWEGDNDCAGDIMLGATARTTLSTRSLNASGAPTSRRRAAQSSGSTLVLGMEGSAGFSPRQGEQALAASIGFPTAIAIKSANMRILPFLTPGLGFGRLGNIEYEEDEAPTAHGAVAFMMGGGFGFQFDRTGIGASLGFQKVFKTDGGATQLGIALSWQGLSVR